MRSAAWALLRFEWRQNGLYPLVASSPVLLLVVLAQVYGLIADNIFQLCWVLTPLLAPPVASFFSWNRDRLWTMVPGAAKEPVGLPCFLATRPVATSELATAKIKIVLLNSLFTSIAVVMLPLCFLMFDPSHTWVAREWGDLSRAQGSLKASATIAVMVFAVWLITCHHELIGLVVRPSADGQKTDDEGTKNQDYFWGSLFGFLCIGCIFLAPLAAATLSPTWWSTYIAVITSMTCFAVLAKLT